jgi:hypothetical protein
LPEHFLQYLFRDKFLSVCTQVVDVLVLLAPQIRSRFIGINGHRSGNELQNLKYSLIANLDLW